MIPVWLYDREAIPSTPWMILSNLVCHMIQKYETALHLHDQPPLPRRLRVCSIICIWWGPKHRWLQLLNGKNVSNNPKKWLSEGLAYQLGEHLISYVQVPNRKLQFQVYFGLKSPKPFLLSCPITAPNKSTTTPFSILFLLTRRTYWSWTHIEWPSTIDASLLGYKTDARLVMLAARNDSFS